MYLKQLQLKGFKSFAHKTCLDFGPGISVIVGPNGSGKSNIADAVRWVLGEQSVKSLRGNKMEDVIFAGSKERKPVGRAQVSLILDNQDGKLPLDFNEVEITRRVFRSGESDFLINQTQCRLKDIHELFMDTGIGKESFSIIGQGKVEEILTAKPEERRYLLEEAAGISKYRYRKQQATKKLEDTEQSINRLQDLLHEIESQLEPLEKQAAAAQKYKQLKTELDTLEIRTAVREISRLSRKINEIQEEKEAALQQIREKETQKSVIEARLEEEKLAFNQLEEQIAGLQQEIYQEENKVQRLEGSMGIDREKLENVRRRRDQVSEELQQLSTKKKQLSAQIDKLQAQGARVEQQIKTLQRNIAAVEKQYEETVAELDNETENNENLKRRLFDLLHRESALKNDMARQEQKRQHSQLQHDRFAEEIQECRKKLEQKTVELQGIIEQKERKQQEIAGLLVKLDECRHKISRLETELAQLGEQYQDRSKRLSNIANRLETLEALNREYEGFYRGVKSVLKAKENGVRQCQGIHGAVAQLIHVPPKYELAVETALGSAAQSVVVQSSKDAEQAIDFLKSSNGGRATFLPLDTIQARPLPGKFQQLLQLPGIIGLARDVVEVKNEYQVVLEHLLGNVIFATNISDAVRAARKSGFRVRIVTLDGEVVNPGGSMAGGSSGAKETGLIRREGEINRLQKQHGEVERELLELAQTINDKKVELEDCRKKLAEIQEKLYQSRSEEETLKNRRQAYIEDIDNLKETVKGLQWQQQQLANEQEMLAGEENALQVQLQQVAKEKEEVEARLAALDDQKEVLEEQKSRLTAEITEQKVSLAALKQELFGIVEKRNAQENLLEETIETLKKRQEEMADLEEQEKELVESIEKKGAQSKIILLNKEKLQEQLEAFREKREAKRQQISELENKLKHEGQQLQNLNQVLNKKEITLTRWETEKENHVNRLWEEHQLTYEQALPYDTGRGESKELHKQIRELRREIAQLGTVNLGAIEEYQRVSERHQFLSKQLSDLQEAKQSLNKVINEMESIMKERFAATFSRVNQCFKEMFQRLFGGGTAELKLTDSDDILAAGIDIVAQPPGKKLSHLSLLSGGEKALTAISLLFGILKIKPSPFCILDEIDASLDEANVNRFAQVLQDFSRRTQFIVISHRQGTMEVADDLYGVTMDKSGVSKLVSVKLEENRVS